jgi:hypothetical protein
MIHSWAYTKKDVSEHILEAPAQPYLLQHVHNSQAMESA